MSYLLLRGYLIAACFISGIITGESTGSEHKIEKPVDNQLFKLKDQKNDNNRF